MAPELHGTPWGIIETGLIREAQRHCSGAFRTRSAARCFMWVPRINGRGARR